MKLLIAVALCACGGANKGGNTSNPASDDPYDCGIVADKVVALMASEAGITEDDAKQKVHASLSGACVTGSWSSEVRACFVNAADATAMGTCGDMLDEAQKQDLVDSIAAGTGAE